MLRRNVTRLLFVGDVWYGSNATSLRDALVRQGCDVLTLDTSSAGRGFATLRKAFGRRLWSENEVAERATIVTQRVDAAVRDWSPDALVAFKALYLKAGSLQGAPFPLIHYHPDDSTNPENRTSVFDDAESAYDLHLTTKSFNVSEIEKRTGKPAHFMWCAYDRVWHRPVRVQAPKFDVAFIGTRRPDRVGAILEVAKVFRKRFLVVGDKWSREPLLRRLAVVRPPAYGLDFSRIVSQARSHLGFVNSDNRDLHTCRSFEIPACGGLLLAEDTVEHRELHGVNEGAAFFQRDRDLIPNILEVLRDEDRASSIAREGFRRITSGDNTYDHRAQTVLSLIKEL